MKFGIAMIVFALTAHLSTTTPIPEDTSQNSSVIPNIPVPSEMSEAEPKKCPSQYFQCPLTKKCIPIYWMCDGEPDCGQMQNGTIDNGDEDPKRCQDLNVCTKNQFRCLNVTGCVPLEVVCNDAPDCVDGSDEGDFCSSNACDGNSCAYGCKPGPDGLMCYCPQGKEPNGTSCQVKRCETNDDCLFKEQCNNQMCTDPCSIYSAPNSCFNETIVELVCLYKTATTHRLTFDVACRTYNHVAMCCCKNGGQLGGGCEVLTTSATPITTTASSTSTVAESSSTTSPTTTTPTTRTTPTSPSTITTAPTKTSVTTTPAKPLQTTPSQTGTSSGKTINILCMVVGSCPIIM